MNADWLILILAGLLEVCWASSLKSTAGFTRLGPSIFFFVSITASLYLLSLAVRHLPMGVAYAVWVGIGAAGTVIVAVIMHEESMTVSRAIFLTMLIGSILGLKYTTSGP